MNDAKTVADILGTVTLVLTAQITLGQHDACSRCAACLSIRYAIYLADCGRYCSRGCAEAHANALLEAHVNAVLVTDLLADLRERMIDDGDELL